MLFSPGHGIIELNVPNRPDWWTDSAVHDFERFDLGQVQATVYKSTDNVLHFYVETDLTRRAVRVERPLTERLQSPTVATLRWDQKSLSLQLDDEPPTHHPWQARPLPPRP